MNGPIKTFRKLNSSLKIKIQHKGMMGSGVTSRPRRGPVPESKPMVEVWLVKPHDS